MRRWVFLCLALALPRLASAESMPLATGGTVTLDSSHSATSFTPGESVSSHRGITNWEDSHDTSFEFGAGGSSGLLGASERYTAYSGGLVVLGIQHHVHVTHEHHEKWDGFESESARWCVPVVMCMGIGLIFAPAGSILGNDFGIELRGGAFGMGGAFEGMMFRASARPTFRYANGMWRTGTLVGTLFPEVGVDVPTKPASAAVTIAWPLYPIDVLVAPGLALAIDLLRVGARVPFEGGRPGADLGAEVTFRWLP